MNAKIARVIDYETTGFPEDEHAEVIEMGSYDLDLITYQIGNDWSSLCLPRGPIPPETKAVHHITEDDVRGAPQARELWELLYEDLGEDDVLVAHNCRFEQHFHAGDGRRWICTERVARVLWPDAPSYSNQALRYWLNLPVKPELAFPPHRALPDAYVTAHLLRRLLDEKTIDEMVKISTYPRLMRRITFGTRAKGQTYEEAPLDYLRWIKDESSMDEDTKFSAHYWIMKRSAR